MSAPAKFLFDNDFSGPERRAKPAGIPEALHIAALSEARAEGYADGLAQGRAQAALDAEQGMARSLERVAAALGVVARQAADIEARLEAEAIEVSVAIAGKLAPALIAREPFAEIAALAGDCFKSLLGAPHIVVRVNDAAYEGAKVHLAEIAASAGFAGRVVVLAEPEVMLGDCRIEWADGGVVRSRAETENAVAEAVGRYLAGRSAPAASIPEM